MSNAEDLQHHIESELQAMMQNEADAFIAIPGGFGTLEELLEMVTWQQLGIHSKPVGVLNVCGYFDHLIAFADHMVQEVCVPLDLCKWNTKSLYSIVKALRVLFLPGWGQLGQSRNDQLNFPF